MAGRNESDDDLDSERNEDTETESELSDDDNTILPPVWSNNTIGPRRIPFLKENKLLVHFLLPPPIQQQQLPRTPPAHRLVKNDERDAKGGTKRKKCRMCYRDGKNKKSIFLCVGCPDRPGLCPVECFDKFHKN